MKWLPAAYLAVCAFFSSYTLISPRNGPGGPLAVRIASARPLTLLTKIGTLLRAKPIFRNSLACMCLSAIGDMLAQRFELLEQGTMTTATTTQQQLLHLNRTATLASFGLLVAGPLYSMWYPFLDALCHPWALAKYGLWATPIVKMMIEMTFLEPVFLSLFFGYMNVAEGKTMLQYHEKMTMEFLPTYKTSLAVWPPYMLLSFRFVPVGAQTIAMNLAMAFWDAFLSYQNARSLHVAEIAPPLAVVDGAEKLAETIADNEKVITRLGHPKTEDLFQLTVPEEHQVTHMDEPEEEEGTEEQDIDDDNDDESEWNEEETTEHETVPV